MTYVRMQTTNLDSRARSAARKVGLTIKKSRRREDIDNFGEDMLVDPFRNVVVSGERFNMSAEEVIQFCGDLAAN
jgi:hypothetical protein